jgi:hypothetical protein
MAKALGLSIATFGFVIGIGVVYLDAKMGAIDEALVALVYSGLMAFCFRLIKEF